MSAGSFRSNTKLSKLPPTLSGVDQDGLVERFLLDGSLTGQNAGLTLTRAGTWNTTSYNMLWDFDMRQYVPVFTGTNYYTFTPTGFVTGGGASSIMCWVKIRSADSIIFFGYGSVAQSRSLGHFSGNFLHTDGINPLSSGISGLSDGTWHHLCSVYNGTTNILYIDGVLQASASYTFNITATSGTIGTYIDYNYIHTGYIADCRFYSTAKTASQVLSIAKMEA